MRLKLTSAAAMSALLGLVIVDPALLTYVGVGAAVGATGAIAIAAARTSAGRRRRPRSAGMPRPPSSQAHYRLPPALAVLAAIAAVAFTGVGVISLLGKLGESMLFSVGAPRHIQGYPESHGIGRSPPPPILEVDYDAKLEYDDSTDTWRLEEVVQIPSRASLVAGTRTQPPSAPSRSDNDRPRRALGEQWEYLRVSGVGASSAFRRERTIPSDIPAWPFVTDQTIRLGHLSSAPYETDLVPQSGSTIEIRAPENLVREIDADADLRHFGGEDIFLLKIEDVEFEPDALELHVRVANSLGRTSIIEGIESVSAWTIFQLLVTTAVGAFVGHFVTTYLKKRGTKDEAESSST